MSEEDLQAQFERQMLPWLGDAYNLAFWLLKHEQDAPDAVQEAYLRAFRFYGGCRIESPKPWLLGIVRNACRDALARRSRQRNLIPMDEQSIEVPDPSPWSSAELVRKSTLEEVRAALEGLPVEFRACHEISVSSFHSRRLYVHPNHPRTWYTYFMTGP